MSIDNWLQFFKPEVRNSGQALLSKAKVSLTQLSDTEIHAFVQASASIKVTFRSQSIDSQNISADCTCPRSKKGQLCKHIWAVLLTIQQKHLDFLSGKSEMHKILDEKPVSAFHNKQADYRKQQYQKQKKQLKDKKQLEKGNRHKVELPVSVEAALKYFLDNGFPLNESLSRESLSLAVKKLSRVFHPDFGGTHSEFVELNDFADILIQHIGK